MRAPSSAKTVRNLVLAALSVALIVLALPWLHSAWYSGQLMLMSPPSTLAMPVAGLKRNALSDTWHASRPPRRRHEGIDIFAKKGTPILATTEGVVVRLGQNPLGGNVVWVLGPGGHRHYYAHLEQASHLAIGDRVQAGTVLGYVGNTGNARTTPPHLHYGVYAYAGAINPYPLLALHQASK